MKIKTSFWTLTLMLIACNSSTKNCRDPSSEVAIQVVKDYFQAITDRKGDQLKRLSTADYVLFENGALWNNDTLISLMNKMPEGTLTYEFQDFEVETDCNSAFLNYRNHGKLTTPDTTLHYYWTESAYLKWTGDTLKLDFLHSTVAK